jgi:hypothetical protein
MKEFTGIMSIVPHPNSGQIATILIYSSCVDAGSAAGNLTGHTGDVFRVPVPTVTPSPKYS